MSSEYKNKSIVCNSAIHGNIIYLTNNKTMINREWFGIITGEVYF